MLHSIAGMAVIVRNNDLFLTPTVTYDVLASFATRSPHPVINEALGVVNQELTLQET